MGLRILGKWKKMRDTLSNQMAIGLNLSSDWLFYKQSQDVETRNQLYHILLALNWKLLHGGFSDL